MKINKNFKLDGLLEFQPNVYGDDRGQFIETFNEDIMRELGFNKHFKQDNQSISQRGVFRGIHLQSEPRSQGKLVRVAKGSVIDYAIDLRRNSPTYGEWDSILLTAEKGNQFWIPDGFGHAFLSLEDDTIFCYKCTETYAPDNQVSILWNDEDISLDVSSQIDIPLLISDKDLEAMTLLEYSIKFNSSL